MVFKKTLALVLAVLMLSTLLCLASCGKKENNGVLTMATNVAFPPYEYYDGEEAVGIDVEIATKIAEKLGMTLEVKDMDFDSVVTAVSTGKADIGMAGLTVTPDRMESVNFSDTYATGIQVIIVADGSEITTVDDLDGHKIGVQQGTTGDIYCSDDYGDENVIKYKTGADAVQALKSGSVDCVVIDNEPAKSFVAANTGLSILDTEYAIEDYAICFAKNNTKLLEKVNKALKELIADGTVKEIVDRYIPAD